MSFVLTVCDNAAKEGVIFDVPQVSFCHWAFMRRCQLQRTSWPFNDKILSSVYATMRIQYASTLVEDLTMNELERYFKGLADNNRLRIMNLLMHGELCGCDIQYVLEASQPNVSRHLTYLKNAGLVEDRRDGYRIYYRLAQKDKAEYRGLIAYLQIAFRDQLFQADTKRRKQAVKDGACSVSEFKPSVMSVTQTDARR
jgi:ArsR family transcriptional regulator